MSRVPPGGAVRVRRPHHPDEERDEVRGERRAEGRAEKRQEIESLLRDLGSQLRRGGGAREAVGHLPVGRDGVDRLLGGGFPLGALSEINGASSSGRTSLCLALLATTTARGELAGWIDCTDAFDPPSAEGLGVDLDRVLWVRARGAREALRAAERLMQTEGFPLVGIDWSERLPAPRTATWIRLARLAAATRTALLLSSAERLAGPHAALALSMQPVGARFSGTPSLLEEIETRMVLVRSRKTLRPPHESAA